MKHVSQFRFLTCLLITLSISILSTNLQAQDCTPGCSKIANGDFESPNVANMTANGHSTYGGTNFPATNSAFVDGEVSCWQAHQWTPHIWPNDTSSSLNHFAAFFTSWYIDSISGYIAETEEASIIIQDFCLESGLHYKIRYDYYGYPLASPWTGWITFSFTNSFNFDVYNPNSGDVIYQEYITTNDPFNTTAIPPPYLNMNWHPMESDSFEFSGQDYLVIAPKFDVNNPTINSGIQYVGVIFIDNIEFIPNIEFDSGVLCSPDSSFLIFPEFLPANTQLEYYPVSSNISNLTNTGDSCIIQVSGMLPNIPSEVIIAYAIIDTACNGEPCIIWDTLTTELLYEPLNSYSYQVQEVSCVPNCDGIVEAVASGGLSPYTYQWSNSVTTSTNNSACLGLHFVTITDDAGCSVINFVIVTDTIHLSTNTSQIQEVSCEPNCDGIIETIPFNGNSPYTYLWSNSVTTSTNNSACVGLNFVTITDDSGCSLIDSVLVTDTIHISTNTSQIQEVSCEPNCDGIIETTPFNGNTPYTYLWSNNVNTITNNSACVGLNFVTITDDSGCSLMDSVLVTDTLHLSTITSQIQEVSCEPNCDGIIETIPFNGNSPYTYLWSNNVNTITNNSACVGLNFVTITDDSGCSLMDSVLVTDTLHLEILNIDIPKCPCNGFPYFVNIPSDSLINGTAPFSYQWSTDPVTVSDTLFNPPHGAYTVTVTDANGCEDEFDFEIYCLGLTYHAMYDALCNETCDGSLLVIGASTTMPCATVFPPVTFAWSNGQTNLEYDNLLNLCPGVYYVTITDSIGQMGIDSVVIGASYNASLSLNLQQVVCNDSCNGEIQIAINNTPSFPMVEFVLYGPNDTTIVQNPTPSYNFTSLCPGEYDMVVTDSAGCQLEASAELFPYTFYIEDTFSLADCQTSYFFDLSITSFGVSPFSYLWNTGDTLPDILAISPDEYFLITTDSNNCQLIDTFIFDVSRLLIYSEIIQPTCDYLDNGQVSLLIYGGQEPITMVWNTGATTQTISNLAPGTYTVTVSDALGCLKTHSVVLNSNNFLSLDGIASHIQCRDSLGNISLGAIDLIVNGGLPPYTYLWSNTATTQDISNLIVGSYSVTVEESNGCVKTYETELIGILDISIDDIGQGCDSANGYAWVDINGGTSPFTYNWCNLDSTVVFYGDSTPYIHGLSDFDVYTLVVTDSLNCVGRDTVEIKSEQFINLPLGWSYWSTYIKILEEDSLFLPYFEELGLDQHIIIMKNFLGLTLYPPLGINQIVYNADESYSIKMQSTQTLHAQGGIICPDTTYIDLSASTKWVSYVRKTPGNIIDMLAPVAQMYNQNNIVQLALSSSGLIYFPEFGINNIGNMEPGEGYRLIINTTGTGFYYPPNSDNVGTKSYIHEYPDLIEEIIQQNKILNTGSSMILGIPVAAWDIEPSIGDWISVYGEMDQLVGRSVYMGDFLAMLLYGDDITTPMVYEGLSSGEQFRIEVGNKLAKAHRVLKVSRWDKGDNRYALDKIAIAASKTGNIETLYSSDSFEFYPNPVSDILKIRHFSDGDETFRIMIDNVNGQFITSRQGSFSSGWNEFELDINSLLDGVYFITISNHKYHFTRKVIKLGTN